MQLLEIKAARHGNFVRAPGSQCPVKSVIATRGNDLVGKLMRAPAGEGGVADRAVGAEIERAHENLFAFHNAHLELLLAGWRPRISEIHGRGAGVENRHDDRSEGK